MISPPDSTVVSLSPKAPSAPMFRPRVGRRLNSAMLTKRRFAVGQNATSRIIYEARQVAMFVHGGRFILVTGPVMAPVPYPAGPHDNGILLPVCASVPKRGSEGHSGQK